MNHRTHAGCPQDIEVVDRKYAVFGAIGGVYLGHQLVEMYHLFFRFPQLDFVLDARVLVAAAAVSALAAFTGVAGAVRRAVHLLAESRGEPWVKKASVLPMIKRLDPTFDPRDHQFASFAELLKSLDSVIEVRKGAGA